MTNSTNPYLTAKAVARKKTDPLVALICAIFAAATASATVTMFSQGKTLSGVMGMLGFAIRTAQRMIGEIRANKKQKAEEGGKQ